MADNLSEFPTDPRKNACLNDGSAINAKLLQICYVFVCISILLFGYLASAHPDVYYLATNEDSWLENFTAVAFLLAGGMLFAAALAARRLFPRFAYILGGLVMAFFAIEEISWGQRIIGFETPDFLAIASAQEEFNIHNRYDVEFIFLKEKEVLFALCIVACIAFFLRKDRIFGIPSPPILLILAILVLLSFASLNLAEGVANYPSGFMSFLQAILTRTRALLLLLLLVLLLFALFSRNAGLFIAVVASLFLVISTAYMVYHYHHHRLLYGEMREYLFSVVCFFYALMALLDQRVARQKIMAASSLTPAIDACFYAHKFLNQPYGGMLFDGIKKSRLTPWASVCALIIASSIGLAFTVHLNARADAAALKEIYSLTRASQLEPVTRSKFDVYLVGRDLYYFKQPCANSDTAARFFLAAFPTNVNDIRFSQRRHGFANLDFDFESKQQRVILDGACAAKVRLHPYEITSVSTGQFVIEEDGAFTNLWIAEFPVGGK